MECMKKRGFTLVELLVVILIISVLAGFLVPAVFQGRKKVARIQCTNNLANIGKLALIYADDNKGQLPVADTEEPRAYESLNLLAEQISDARKGEMYVCPASQDEELERERVAYFIKKLFC